MADLEVARGSGMQNLLRVGLGAVLALGAYQVWEYVGPAAPPIVYEGGTVLAAAELNYVLDDPRNGGGASGITVGEQFAGPGGERCRTFKQGFLAGSACFYDGQWRVLELTQAPAPAVDAPAELSPPVTPPPG